jgi:hypothetical protein
MPSLFTKSLDKIVRTLDLYNRVVLALFLAFAMQLDWNHTISLLFHRIGLSTVTVPHDTIDNNTHFLPP